MPFRVFPLFLQQIHTGRTDDYDNEEELRQLLKSTETYRIERTVSTGNKDKFSEAICAFSNDLPGSHKNGYLIIGAEDDGEIKPSFKVTDALLKNIAAASLGWQHTADTDHER